MIFLHGLKTMSIAFGLAIFLFGLIFGEVGGHNDEKQKQTQERDGRSSK